MLAAIFSGDFLIPTLNCINTDVFYKAVNAPSYCKNFVTGVLSYKENEAYFSGYNLSEETIKCLSWNPYFFFLKNTEWMAHYEEAIQEAREIIPHAKKLYITSNKLSGNVLIGLYKNVYDAYCYHIGEYWLSTTNPIDITEVLKREREITQLALKANQEYLQCSEKFNLCHIEALTPHHMKWIISIAYGEEALEFEVEEVEKFEDAKVYLQYLQRKCPELSTNIKKIGEIAEKCKPFFENKKFDLKILLTIHKFVIQKILECLQPMTSDMNWGAAATEYMTNVPLLVNALNLERCLKQYEKEYGPIKLPTDIW